jgi:hypothetical protein
MFMLVVEKQIIVRSRLQAIPEELVEIPCTAGVAAPIKVSLVCVALVPYLTEKPSVGATVVSAQIPWASMWMTRPCWQ